MKTANSINKLAALLKTGETQIKIYFEDCSHLHYILVKNYKIDLGSHDISDWDVSDVRDMYRMFYDAKSFNQDIGKWNVSNVNNMQCMFYYAESFNQDISNWKVNQAADTCYMFRHCPIEEGFKPKGVIK